MFTVAACHQLPSSRPSLPAALTRARITNARPIHNRCRYVHASLYLFLHIYFYVRLIASAYLIIFRPHMLVTPPTNAAAPPRRRAADQVKSIRFPSFEDAHPDEQKCAENAPYAA